MQVETVQMDPRIAAVHYKDYRKKVREHRAKRLAEANKKILVGGQEIRRGRVERTFIEQEDEVLMASYREMAKGQRILNVAHVMRAFGVDKDSKSRLPLLAIGQADWKHTWLRQHDNKIVFSSDSYPHWDYRHNKYKNGAIGFLSDVFPPELTNSEWRRTNNLPAVQNKRALTPAIPAHLRPAGDLSGYHILWEAKWVHEAPPDPLLLKHVSGHIYTVLAQWDLTPIEKMVLEGRAV